MQLITCAPCNTSNQFHVTESGPHLKAICNHCNKYIKFVSKEHDLPRLYFGKYKGQYIHHTTDVNYLEWALLNVDLNKLNKEAITTQINKLKCN